MAKGVVRVYVLYDVEVQIPEKRQSWGTEPIVTATRQVQTFLQQAGNMSDDINVVRRIFGATLLPNEMVVYLSDSAQVIKVREA